MKRLVTIYGNTDEEELKRLSDKMRDSLLDKKYENILFGAPKDTVIQMVELEDDGEYRCITISRKGVKIQKVPIERVSKW